MRAAFCAVGWNRGVRARSLVNQVKRAFDHCVDEYARYRPGYPPALYDHVETLRNPSACGWAADVGAGTGIFTRGLNERGYRVIALEPSLAMLLRVGDNADGAVRITRRLCSTAERMGLADGSVELVACAQSFHWFDSRHALAEFARVLGVGGILVLTWNNRDHQASSLVEEFESLVRRYNPSYDVDYRRQDWAGKIERSGLFETAQIREFTWDWVLGQDEFVRFTRSVSYIRNVIARDRIGGFERDLGGILRDHAGEGNVGVAMRTECWSAVRR